MYTTFFSFKGGVGRTTCMMNTALCLAKMGKTVVGIDLDLEAPGVDVFEQSRVDREDRPGMVELCNHFRAHDSFPRPEDMKEYAYEVRPSNEELDMPVYLIRAGIHEDDGYGDDVRRANLLEMLEPGARDVPRFVSRFREAVRATWRPDYVLLDLRPGLTPISLNVMKWFGQAIILVFNMSPWNIEGVVTAYKDCIKFPQELHGMGRNIRLVISPVAHYTKRSEQYKLKKREIQRRMQQAFARHGLGSEPVSIPFNEDLTMKDTLIVELDSDDDTALAYQQAASLVVAQNPEDVSNKIRMALAADNNVERRQALEKLANSHRNSFEVRYAYGKFLLEEGHPLAEDVLLSAAVRAREDMEQKAKDSPARRNKKGTYGHAGCEIEYARALLSIGKKEKDEQKLLKSIESCKRALAINDKKFDAHRIWAQASIAIAGLQEQDCKADDTWNSCGYATAKACENAHRDGEQEGRLRQPCPYWLMQADEQYEHAISLDEDNADLLCLRGQVQDVLARFEVRSSKEQANLVRKANKYYETSIRKKHNNPDANYRLGRNLYRLSQERLGIQHIEQAAAQDPHHAEAQSEVGRRSLIGSMTAQDRDSVLEQLDDACTRFEQATNENNLSKAYYYWGLAQVARAAFVKEPQEQWDALVTAWSRFAEATSIQRDFKEAYFYWGVSMFLAAAARRDEWKGMTAEHTRQSFYKLEWAIALHWWDETQGRFYFDPEEIDAINESPFTYAICLEKMLKIGEDIAGWWLRLWEHPDALEDVTCKEEHEQYIYSVIERCVEGLDS